MARAYRNASQLKTIIPSLLKTRYPPVSAYFVDPDVFSVFSFYREVCPPWFSFLKPESQIAPEEVAEQKTD